MSDNYYGLNSNLRNNRCASLCLKTPSSFLYRPPPLQPSHWHRGREKHRRQGKERGKTSPVAPSAWKRIAKRGGKDLGKEKQEVKCQLQFPPPSYTAFWSSPTQRLPPAILGAWARGWREQVPLTNSQVARPQHSDKLNFTYKTVENWA